MHFFRLTVKYSTQEKYFNFFFFHPEKKRSPKGESILSGVRDPKKYYRRIFIQRKKNIYF